MTCSDSKDCPGTLECIKSSCRNRKTDLSYLRLQLIFPLLIVLITFFLNFKEEKSSEIGINMVVMIVLASLLIYVFIDPHQFMNGGEGMVMLTRSFIWIFTFVFIRKGLNPDIGISRGMMIESIYGGLGFYIANLSIIVLRKILLDNFDYALQFEEWDFWSF